MDNASVLMQEKYRYFMLRTQEYLCDKSIVAVVKMRPDETRIHQKVYAPTCKILHTQNVNFRHIVFVDKETFFVEATEEGHKRVKYFVNNAYEFLQISWDLFERLRKSSQVINDIVYKYIDKEKVYWGIQEGLTRNTITTIALSFDSIQRKMDQCIS